MKRQRYVVVGTGGRSGMYIDALADGFPEVAELVGLCDRNPGRLEMYADRIAERTGRRVPTFRDDEFDRMMDELQPDRVVVTTGPDRTHADYIIRSMRAGCDVVTEKPMTTTVDACREILHTRAETGKDLQVTFNYRYAPPRAQVRRLIDEGAIGEVLGVDFAWTLDTRHGADYFRRWHRRLENSGSLLVHKATHHFDLVNWWIGDLPEEVFAHGTRRYYTPEHAEDMGLAGRAERCLECPVASSCPFHVDLQKRESLQRMYLDHEAHDGYFRDRCVFSDEIDIWDTMSVTVRYRHGALLSYMLHAYSPVEGYRIAFNGTKGRLEHVANEKSYLSGDGTVPGELKPGRVGTTLIREFERPQALEVETGSGGHGGGDPMMLAELIRPNASGDPLRQRANHRDGTYSIMVGIAAYTSIRCGEPVRISELLGDAPLGDA